MEIYLVDKCNGQTWKMATSITLYWEPVTSELLFIIILFFRFSNRPFPPFIFQIHLSLPPLSAIRKISKEILHVTWIPHETLMSSLHKQIKKSISRAIIDLIEDIEYIIRPG